MNIQIVNILSLLLKQVAHWIFCFCHYNINHTKFFLLNSCLKNLSRQNLIIQYTFVNSGKVGIAKAKELAFTARMIGGNEAATLGLVNRCGKHCIIPLFLGKQGLKVGSNVTSRSNVILKRQKWYRNGTAVEMDRDKNPSSSFSSNGNHS